MCDCVARGLNLAFHWLVAFWCDTPHRVCDSHPSNMSLGCPVHHHVASVGNAPLSSALATLNRSIWVCCDIMRPWCCRSTHLPQLDQPAGILHYTLPPRLPPFGSCEQKTGCQHQLFAQPARLLYITPFSVGSSGVNHSLSSIAHFQLDKLL